MIYEGFLNAFTQVQTVAFVHSTMRASSRQPVVTLSPGRSDALPTLNVFPEDQDAQRYFSDPTLVNDYPQVFFRCDV